MDFFSLLFPNYLIDSTLVKETNYNPEGGNTDEDLKTLGCL